MTAFFEIILSFPTVLFTLPLAFAAAYWSLAVVGILDIELLDSADGVLDGGVDGALDGAMDGALDGAMDGAVDGALDAAGEALEGAADGTTEALEAVGSPGGVLLLIANVLRLKRVPATVSLTSFIFWGWISGFLLTYGFRTWLTPAVSHLVFSAVSMVACLAAAALLTNVSVRPLEPVFKTHKGRERKSLIGEVCEVTTGRVDAGFGQGAALVGVDDLLFHIRCDQMGNGLKKGDRALIVHFDSKREAYIVEPLSAAESIG